MNPFPIDAVRDARKYTIPNIKCRLSSLIKQTFVSITENVKEISQLYLAFVNDAPGTIVNAYQTGTMFHSINYCYELFP